MSSVRFESRAVGWLKSGLFAIATLVTLWSQTNFTATLFAVAFAILGSQLGRSMSKRHLKTSVALALGISTLALSWFGADWFRDSGLNPLGLKAEKLLVVSDIMGFSLAAFGVSFSVRFMSTRRRIWSIVETFIVIASVVLLFSRHQHLAYHRPRFLADWALVNGLDPQVLLQGIGVVAALVAIVMMLWKQSRQKLVMSMVLLLVLGLVAYQQQSSMKLEPPIEDFLKEQSVAGQGQSNQDKPYPVAVALLHTDYEPEADLLYFRQQVQGHFNGKRLVSSPTGEFAADVITQFPGTDPIRITDETQKAAFHKRVPTSMFLMVDHPQPLGLTASIEISPRPNPSPAKFVAAYDVVSLAPTTKIHDMRYLGRRSVPADWSQAQKDHYLTGPDDPRYDSLANEIVREVDPRYSNDTLVKALAVKRYLEKNGFYTREERHDNQPDPAASFLFGNLRGYCVHFAHAAALLFRTVGIASRVAVGYAVDNRMRGSGSAVLIMGDRAHAWPEIHIDGVGWIAFDIYPEQSDQPPPQLVSQDLESLLGELARNDKSGGRALEAQNTPFQIPWDSIRYGLFMLFVSLFTASYLIKVARRVRPSMAGRFRQRWAFSAVLDQLSDLGLGRDFGETRENHAKRVKALAPSFEKLTHQHLSLSLSESGTSEGMMEQCKQVGTELKMNLPRWKRALGTINPIGWYFTR
ncbi:MAG: transglutaminase-like domain-containing protein [Myxococcota bacterium]|nr:transglutaminase-like domain-containing protein [Myxococcota bacterium]